MLPNRIATVAGVGICGLTLLVALGHAPAPLHGQEAKAEEGAYGEEFWSSLEWRNVGPARGGRSIAAAGSTLRPFEYYMGTTGGGLWKTTDGGLTWDPVTDGTIGSASIGAVAVC